MRKTRLFTPGPTPVPPSVMLRTAEPIIHHRTEEFRSSLGRVHENLKYLYVTEQPVLLLAASGSGAMEAALANTMSSGDRIVTVSGGKFGERWGEIGRAWGLDVDEITVEWGNPVDVDRLLERVGAGDTRGVCLTHSETSTGTFTDVRSITRTLRDSGYEGLVIVDGITAVGAHEMHFDDWDLDVVVTGSQKGLMIPPGLACIALSERAWGFHEASSLPRFYFDLSSARKAHGKEDTPWTPAVTLVLALDEALGMIREEGRENVWRRHERLADACRAGVVALGFELLSSSPSNALTAIKLVDELSDLPALLKNEFGCTVAGGQGHLKGKIARISHLGYYDDADMIGFFGLLEQAVARRGVTVEPGSGVAAASRSIAAAANEVAA